MPKYRVGDIFKELEDLAKKRIKERELEGTPEEEKNIGGISNGGQTRKRIGKW